ncbi:unnamed protein product [Caenorhabditis brenneri]
MADFFKNNPIALRHCVLYVFLQKQSVEEAYKDFCEAVGPDVIKKKAFRYWFKQFEKGKFDDKEHSFDNIADVLRNNKQALRACVMYEWMRSEDTEIEDTSLGDVDMIMLMLGSLDDNSLPVFAKYKSFCKVIGDGVMEYKEFDFWFYRFVNGEFDLNFERDEGEKTRELSDMPTDVMEHIVGYLNIFDRSALAETSHSFKTFVEDQKAFCPGLKFQIDDDTAFSSVADCTIFTEKKGNGCLKKTVITWPPNEEFIEGVPHWKQALMDLKNALKLPKLHFKDFTFQLVSRSEKLSGELSEDKLKIFDEVTDALEVLFKPSQPLHVEFLTLTAHSMEPLLKILPSLKSGYLKMIEISISKAEQPDRGTLENLYGLEQWKRAKYINMVFCLFALPLSQFYHFKKFYVHLDESSVEIIRQMKEFLFKSPGFERCSLMLYSRVDESAFEQEFGDAVIGAPNIYLQPIPDSNEFFEIEISTSQVNVIRRKG